MNQGTNTEGNVEVSIPELRLRPGTELRMLDSKGSMLPHKAQFIAVFAGKSILVSLKVDDTRKIALREGDSYTFKGFTGMYDFTFTTTVLQLDGAQFNARLSCPASVSVKFVRSHLRVQLTLPGSVKQANLDTPIPIVVSDLSAGGAGLDSKTELGAVGERIQLVLPVEFERKTIHLNLTSEIRHITRTEHGLKTGVEFEGASQNDKLMLHYFVGTLSEGGAVIAP